MIQVNENIVLFPEEKAMVAVIPEKTRHLAVQMPGLKKLASEHSLLVELPWCEDSCRVLGNLGVDAKKAAPLYHSNLPLVEGKYKPMEHQRLTAAFISFNPRCYVLSDPRTGKTGALIMGMDYLQRSWLVGGAFLIITTVTTIPDVWVSAIKKTLPSARVVKVHGRNREQALSTPADFYVTNYDSVRLSGNEFVRAVEEQRIRGMVVDELTHAGNAGSQRSKAMQALSRSSNMQYVIGATGSPGSDPDTIFGMCQLINPDRLPCKGITAWRGMTTYQWGSERWQRALATGATKLFHHVMQPAIRFEKSSVIDLPPVVTQTRSCSLSKEQNKYREQLKNDAIALLDSGETITAVNGGVLYTKLLQVAQGFCNDDDGQPFAMPYKDRVDTIVEAIRETDRKVVVFGFYKFSNRRLAEDLRAAGFTVEVVDGSVTGERRAEILHRFQHEPDPHVLVCHPTTTAYGVELSAADTIIFNGPPPLGQFIYAQALERLSSSKQTASKIQIIQIIATPEEDKAFTMLDADHNVSQKIGTMFAEIVRSM